MTNYRFFEVYLQILNVIFNLYKYERFKILQDDFKTELSFMRQDTDASLMNELHAATKVPLILTEIEEILHKFSELNPLDN